MNTTRFLRSIALIFSFFVTSAFAQAETRTISFSHLNFIFDSGYLINASLELFPDSTVLGYDSESYPGAILASSRRAVLTTLSDVPETEHRAVLEDVFCSVTSSIVVAYGERYEYEVLLVRIAIEGDALTFTTEAVQLVTARRVCR